MPASSSFPSDGRGKWKRRKRDPHTSRKPSRNRHDDDEEDEDDAVPDAAAGTNNNRGDSEEQPQPSDPNPTDAEVMPHGGIRLCDFPSVIRRSVARPHATVLAVVAIERANLRGETSDRGHVLSLENVSYGQLQTVSTVPREVSDGVGGSLSGGGGYVVTPPSIMEGKGVVKRFGNRLLVVPVHSDWFSPATVHRLERQVVPQFFSLKSPDRTPEKYMECRNYIVAKYMENPKIRLSVADCQELVDGFDNEDLTRIFRFLDHWGIINYCASPPSHESWNSQLYLREDPTGEVLVPSAALKTIDGLIKFDKPTCSLKAVDVYSPLSGHDDDSSDFDLKIRERLTENYCSCCSQPLPIMYYQSQKEVDAMLCLNCFHEGRFVAGHSSLDFVKLDATKDYGEHDGESWSDQETLLLLEALEIYNENWNEIAEHVGTKSKAQCILHFLRLPMDDCPLEAVEVPCAIKPSNMLIKDTDVGMHASSNGSCIQEADSESRLPFSNSGNPVMALVAFLASAVGPRVAAACAHASLGALSEDSRMNSERSLGTEGNIHGETSNSNQEDDRMHNTQGQNETSVVPLSAEKVKEAAKVGLAAAATKAKLFADHEEREIQRLSANIINHQLKRLELKLKQFAEVESFLMRECEQVEKARQRLMADRTHLLSGRSGAAGSTSRMNLAAVPSSMLNNNIGNNRSQVMPPSSSQPSISGYGNPQQVHPHISFMQRSQGQMMFPLGPRLPLSAIQPSSSAQPNVMFNAAAAGNSQAGVNQMMRQMSGPGNGLG